MSNEKDKSVTEIVITVEDDPIRGTRTAKPVTHRRGPYIPAREADYLPRRKTGGVGINFYDFGQITNGHGGWTDAPYHLSSLADVPAASYEPLAHAPNTYKTRYRKIRKGNEDLKYLLGLETNNTPPGFNNVFPPNPDWTESGYKIGPANITSIRLASNGPSHALDPPYRAYYSGFTGAVLHNDVEFGNAGAQKITIGNSFGSPDVTPLAPLDKTKGIDVFLSPMAMDITGSPFTEIFAIIPRTGVIDDPRMFTAFQDAEAKDYLIDAILGPGTYAAITFGPSPISTQLSWVIMQGATVYYGWQL